MTSSQTAIRAAGRAAFLASVLVFLGAGPGWTEQKPSAAEHAEEAGHDHKGHDHRAESGKKATQKAESGDGHDHEKAGKEHKDDDHKGHGHGDEKGKGRP